MKNRKNAKLIRELPIVIDETGVYIMRNGKRALIHAIKKYPHKDVTAFNCKGSIERQFRGKMRFKEHSIWHPSGRNKAFECEFDIVEKYHGGAVN